MRKLLLLLAVFIPCPFKLWFYRNLFGWKIGKQVKVGLSYIEAGNVILEDGAQIGHFNIIRQVSLFQLSKNAYIRNFNQFFGNKYDSAEWTKKLIIGERSLCMNHHFIDVAGTIEIGSDTVIGGRDSHFWSHSLEFENTSSKLVPKDIFIGNNVYIGARTSLFGCYIPDNAIIGMGSVVTKSFNGENDRVLIAGNPAIIKKRYSTL